MGGGGHTYSTVTLIVLPELLHWLFCSVKPLFAIYVVHAQYLGSHHSPAVWDGTVDISGVTLGLIVAAVVAGTIVAWGTVVAAGVVVITSPVDVAGGLSTSVDDVDACHSPWRVCKTAWTARCTASSTHRGNSPGGGTYGGADGYGGNGCDQPTPGAGVPADGISSCQPGPHDQSPDPNAN